ncbi:HEAT repeat domain-containing protein [Streptomyces sp. NPDC048419]|uniref:HEAT repeat domain-containing protein n=1 Tax=Streptomyces sp. NPDC048419 TaxID=3365547 RepID=UPI00371CAB77
MVSPRSHSTGGSPVPSYRQRLQQLELAWTTLSSADARRRAIWADNLGDLLGWACLEQAEAERVAGRLVQLALTAGDHAVGESALHAVAEAGVRYKLPYAVVEPLADNIGAFDPMLLEYVLFSLSATHDERARAPIEPFLTHPVADVRREAAIAIAELDSISAARSGATPSGSFGD